MNLTANHLVVNRNPLVKIGQVVFSSKFRSWCLKRFTFKWSSLINNYLISKACALSSKEGALVVV